MKTHVKEFALAINPLLRADGEFSIAASLAKQAGLAGFRTKSALGGFEHSDLTSSYVDYVNGIFLTALEHGGGVFQYIKAHGKRAAFYDRLFIANDSVAGQIVAENKPIPVGKYSLSGSAMTPQKAAAIAVGSREALSKPEGVEWLSQDLVENMTLAVDGQVCSVLKAAATPATATSDPVADLSTLIGSVVTTGLADLLLIVSPAVARILSTWTGSGSTLAFPDLSPTGGIVCGINTVVTAGCTSDEAILIDCRGLVSASDELQISLTENAMIEMDSAPTGASDTPVGASTAMVSLFQAEALAVKAVLAFGLKVLRPSAVHVIESISWS